MKTTPIWEKDANGENHIDTDLKRAGIGLITLYIKTASNFEFNVISWDGVLIARSF